MWETYNVYTAFALLVLSNEGFRLRCCQAGIYTFYIEYNTFLFLKEGMQQVTSSQNIFSLSWHLFSLYST